MPFLNSARSVYGAQAPLRQGVFAKDGLSSATAGDSAYQIKTDTGASTDGLYWIKNPNINSGTPFQVYCDMTKNGGGWTLLLNVRGDAIQYMGWTDSTVQLRNTSSPSMLNPYSIIGWGDYIKKAPSMWQWMVEASQSQTTRYTNGGIFTANTTYSINSNTPNQTNITANEWFTPENGFADSSRIGQRVPWRGTGVAAEPAALYTTYPGNSSWWGTIVQTDLNFSSYGTGPWITPTLQNPSWARLWIR